MLRKKWLPGIIIVAAGFSLLFVNIRLQDSEALIPDVKSAEVKKIKRSISLEEIKNPDKNRQGTESLDSPVFSSPPEASDFIFFEEPGMVVALGDEQRFYPYASLKKHPIINDVVDGIPILVSFCESCNSGVVFERRLFDKVLTFEITGKVYRTDWLLYDTQTKNIWSQISGEAVIGKNTGEKLSQLDSSVMLFKEFVEIFPEGVILLTGTL